MLPMLEVGRKEDRECVKRIVGGRCQNPAILNFEHGGVAIARMRLLTEIRDDQRLPRNATAGGRRFGRSKQARSEIGREAGEEIRVILLLATVDPIRASLPAIFSNAQLRRFPLGGRFDRESCHERGAIGRPSQDENPLSKA